MGWVIVVIAGLLEIAWAQSIKATDGFSKLMPSVVCVGLTAAVIYALALAMRTLPTGTAYVVFTGIGAIGTATAGMVFLKEPAGIVRVLALTLIVSGVILLYLAEHGPAAHSLR